MTLARLSDLLVPAAASGKGLGAFNVFSIEHAEAFTAAAEVATACHEGGLDVEAELGVIGGKDGVHAAGARTRPDEAQTFVQATGVDALAVAVGTSHAMTERHVSLDLDLIKELRAAVPVPLVLHGSSGVPDQELVNAVESGMTKINIATHLNHVFTNSVRGTLAASPSMVDSRRYLGPARDAVAAEAARLLRLLYRPLTTA